MHHEGASTVCLWLIIANACPRLTSAELHLSMTIYSRLFSFSLLNRTHVFPRAPSRPFSRRECLHQES